MRKAISYLLLVVVGMVAGAWLCRSYHFDGDTQKVQVDSVVIYDTIRYSRLDLASLTTPLEISKVTAPELVYIPEYQLDTIYRDNIRYVTLPRQNYFTETEDAQIWHSGVDSTIDSLNVFRESKIVTQTVRQSVAKRHSLGVGIETSYAGVLSTPVYIEYERILKPWMSAYALVSYDLPSKRYGVGIGIKAQIEW